MISNFFWLVPASHMFSYGYRTNRSKVHVYSIWQTTMIQEPSKGRSSYGSLLLTALLDNIPNQKHAVKKCMSTREQKLIFAALLRCSGSTPFQPSVQWGGQRMTVTRVMKKARFITGVPRSILKLSVTELSYFMILFIIIIKVQHTISIIKLNSYLYSTVKYSSK